MTAQIESETYGKYSISELTAMAENGDLEAQFELGITYENTKEYAQAFAWYSKAAKQGMAAAQCKLGNMYRDGLGIPQDYKLAFAWFSRAAESGDVAAQYNLGLMYDDGEGLPQDVEAANGWFLKAAEQGDADAQRIIGKAYFEVAECRRTVDQHQLVQYCDTPAHEVRIEFYTFDLFDLHLAIGDVC